MYQKRDDQVKNSESENTYNIREGGKESMTCQTRTIKNIRNNILSIKNPMYKYPKVNN